MDGIQCAVCELNVPVTAGNDQPMFHVALHFLAIQVLELVPDGDPVVELSQGRGGQESSQFRLSYKDDLEQLFLLGFQVG